MEPAASDLPLALSILAVAVAIAAAIRAASGDLNAGIFLQVLRKLVAASNLERLIKLCTAASPHIPCAVGVKRMALRCLEPPPQPDGGGSDYRQGAADPAPLASALLRAAYREATAPLLRRLRVAAPLALAAFSLATAAAALASPLLPHPRVSWWYTVLLSVAALASVWTLHVLRRIHTSTGEVLEGIEGELARGWATGYFLEEKEEPTPSLVPTMPVASPPRIS